MKKINFKKILVAIIAFSIMYCVLMVSLIFSGMSDAPLNKEPSAILVLGAGLKGEHVSLRLKNRLDTAFNYAVTNHLPIIVSGGQGPDELIPESLAMKRYLIDKGIASERIIEENASTSTYENLAHSQEIISNRLTRKSEVVLVTSDFHMFRARFIAKSLGINALALPARHTWQEHVKLIPREILAIAKSYAEVIVSTFKKTSYSKLSVGTSTQELVDKLGLPQTSDYFLGGLYFRYPKLGIVYFSDADRRDGTIRHGKVTALAVFDGKTLLIKINLGMTFEDIKKVLGQPIAFNSPEVNSDSEIFEDKWTAVYTADGFELVYGADTETGPITAMYQFEDKD